MSVSEFQRHEVFKWLEEKMGPERAAIMMDLLPPVGWGDIVTTRDLHAEVGGLRSEMQAGFAELRAEMHAGFSEMHVAHSGLLVSCSSGWWRATPRSSGWFSPSRDWAEPVAKHLGDRQYWSLS